jgi:hypothetical protein
MPPLQAWTRRSGDMKNCGQDKITTEPTYSSLFMIAAFWACSRRLSDRGKLMAGRESAL